MKYHPEILYAKYHFVRRVGWHLKINKCVQKWSKIDQKVQNVLYLWFFWALPMATLVGSMKYLFLFVIEETYDCFKE